MPFNYTCLGAGSNTKKRRFVKPADHCSHLLAILVTRGKHALLAITIDKHAVSGVGRRRAWWLGAQHFVLFHLGAGVWMQWFGAYNVAIRAIVC
jgi:hypothetical protein